MNDDPTPAKSTDQESPAAGPAGTDVTAEASPAQGAPPQVVQASTEPSQAQGPASGQVPDSAPSSAPAEAAAEQSATASTATATAGDEPGAKRAAAAKKTPARKAAAKKTANKGTAARKTAARKTAARKTAARKTAATEEPAKHASAAAEQPAKDESAAKTTRPKKATAKKAAAARAATTKAPAKKAAAPTAAQKKATARRAPAKAAAAGKATPKPSPQQATAAAAGAAPSSRSGRDYDIVVYGATGFVGQLIAKYLAANAPAGVSIALAGRSLDKLRAVREQLPNAADWPLITASTQDTASLDAMAASSKVVLTTVGPYLIHGLPVVEACAKNGTHYADLTGEVLFMRQSIDAFNGAAKDSGARIVHSCGFDSIPSDLGVFALHQAAKADADGTLGQTRLGVQSLRGGFSGGTVASMLAGLDAVAEDPSLGRIAADPYGLSPNRAAEPSPGDGNWAGVGYDRILNSWVSPFIMAIVNTRVVRRSNALLGYAYSKDFRYQEMTMNGRGPGGLVSAAALAGGLAVGYGALNFGPTRQLAERLLPSPGEGPDEDARENGFFSVRLASKTDDGRRYQGLVAAQGDPGYAATAVMISQCALALALEEPQLPDRAGVLTPATALGQPVIDRLRGAGMTLHAYRV